MKTFFLIMGLVLVGVLVVVFANSHFYSIGIDNEDSATALPLLPKIDSTKAIYITVNTALGKRINEIIQLVKSRDINSVVIDVKDDSASYLNQEMRRLVRRLRFAGIIPVARLPVFQHNGLARAHLKSAIKTENSQLWRDSGGRLWLDPASHAVWEIILDEAKAAAAMGFAEINLDYIRFPSDGQLNRAVYPFWDKKISRQEIINQFSRFIKDGLKKDFPDVQLTADVFGYLLLRDDDLGIGQSVTDLAEIFDYIYPMIYPSHYVSGNFNFTNPAAHPYEVVLQSLESGKKIFEKHQQPFIKIKPWLQDFNLGAVYTPEMVRLQMKAVTDAGLKDGWLVWNPSNKYRAAIFDARD